MKNSMIVLVSFLGVFDVACSEGAPDEPTGSSADDLSLSECFSKPARSQAFKDCVAAARGDQSGKSVGPACQSAYQAVNGAYQCTTTGKQGTACTAATCEALCEVCSGSSSAGSSSAGSSSGAPRDDGSAACQSGSQGVNGHFECTTEGKRGLVCTEATCDAVCSVCK